MNDKVKLFVLAGVILPVLTGFYFLLMEMEGRQIARKLRKHPVAKEENSEKTEVSKDVDLHEIYPAGGMFLGGVEESFTRVWSNRCRFRLCKRKRGNNQVRID